MSFRAVRSDADGGEDEATGEGGVRDGLNAGLVSLMAEVEQLGSH